MQIDYIETLINMLLASFGGFVKRLAEQEKNANSKVSFSYYIIGSFISLFVGIVVYFICKNFEVSQFMTAGITALSGYMGSPVLDILSEILKRRVKKAAELNGEKLEAEEKDEK